MHNKLLLWRTRVGISRRSLPSNIFFVSPDFDHLFFYHLSLKEMSHAQPGESCGICWIQFIFLLPTEPLQLGVSRISLSALICRCPGGGYQLWPTSGTRTSDLTQTAGEGERGSFSLLLTSYSSEEALFLPAITIKHNLNNINTLNTYVVTCQQFFNQLPLLFIWCVYLLSVSAMFVLVEIPPTVS